MSHTTEEYAALLRDLLPPGLAFRREPGTQLEQILLGAAEELSRVEARGDALTDEVNPASTTELLSDWERASGLPDRCAGVLEDTLQGRRAALLAKITSTGGQSIEYFISVAKALGYEITIDEFRPFQAGRSRAGDALYNGDWRYVWRVNAPETTIIEFRAGRSAAGEPLRSWGNAPLECKINQLKPAHTMVLFGYGGEAAKDTYAAAQRLFYVTNFQLPADTVSPNE